MLTMERMDVQKRRAQVADKVELEKIKVKPHIIGIDLSTNN